MANDFMGVPDTGTFCGSPFAALGQSTSTICDNNSGLDLVLGFEDGELDGILGFIGTTEHNHPGILVGAAQDTQPMRNSVNFCHAGQRASLSSLPTANAANKRIGLHLNNALSNVENLAAAQVETQPRRPTSYYLTSSPSQYPATLPQDSIRPQAYFLVPVEYVDPASPSTANPTATRPATVLLRDDGSNRTPNANLSSNTTSLCLPIALEPELSYKSQVSGFNEKKFRVVSIHGSRNEALIAVQGGNYVYLQLYNYGGDKRKRVVYRCMSHLDCGHRLRVGMHASLDSDAVLWAVEDKGSHCGAETNRVRSGIHPTLKKTVDAMARGGAGPKKILKQLAVTYSQDPVMLQKFPKLSQVKSRKYFLMQELEKGWKLKTFVDLCEWCNPRMCETKDSFFGSTNCGGEMAFQLTSFDFQNQPIVLKCFEHTYVDDGKTKECFGIVLTSRRLFRHVLYSVEGQARDGVFVATDGTYRLHHGNWTLVPMCTYRLRYTRGKYSKNFVPWAYMFVRSEHQGAYEELFRAVTHFAHTFFGIDLDVKFGSLDHSASIANAYSAVWPGVDLLDCYAHVARKCREKSGLLRDKRFYASNIAVNVKQMHSARTPEQFTAIATKCVAYWRKQNENTYADWFEAIYLAERWSKWFTTCAIPGILPSQNALESHNGVIKTCGVTSKRAKTGVVLNDSIPGVLALSAQEAATTPFGHICEGPLLSAMVSRAFVHVTKGGYFDHIQSDNGIVSSRSILFNSSQYRQKPNESITHRVTKLRVERYLKGKAGNIFKGCSVLDITPNYQSLHEVIFLKPTEQPAQLLLKLDSTIKAETIELVRSLYQCDCKAFWNSGWMCSHVIAVMEIVGQFRLVQALSILPVTKVSGGQRKIRGALETDDQTSKAFTKGYLVSKLLANPLYVIWWQVQEEFDVTVDGVTRREIIPGIVKAQ